MFKRKKTIRKIFTTTLIALIISMSAPVIMGFFASSQADSQTNTPSGSSAIQSFTAFAADAKPEAEPPADEKAKDDTKDEKKETTSTSTSKPAEVDGLQAKVSFIQQIQKFLNLLMWPLLVLTGGLMDSSLLFGGGMEDLLREIWIPIRNVVNLLFVVALVVIALYNVLGLGEAESEYSVKKILPSIMIGIIAVNFSFTGIKIFLDMVNVLTVSIFSIPGSIQEELSNVIDEERSTKDKQIIERFCFGIQGQLGGFDEKSEIYNEKGELKHSEEYYIAQTQNAIARSIAGSSRWNAYKLIPKSTATKAEIAARVKTNLNQSNQAAFNKEYNDAYEGAICHGTSLSDQGRIFLKKWNARNGALALALNMTNIVFYQDIPLNTENLEKLLVNTIFSLLLYIVYAASFVALFVVLLARLVILWLAIAVSPVLLLLIAVPSLKDKMGDFGQLTDQFVKNAIAPILIALAMTVGWIMLRGIQSMTSIETGSSLSIQATAGTPLVAMTTLQDLMVALGTVAVVWLGVFSAASTTIAAPVTDAIKGGLGKAASWLGQLPLKHAPIFPIKIPGEDKPFDATFSQIQQTVRDMTEESTEKRNKLSRMINPQANTGIAHLKEKVRDADQLKAWIKENRGKMDHKEMYKALRAWKDKIGTSEYKQILKDLKNNKLARYIETVTSGDGENAKEAYKKLKEDSDINRAGHLDTSSSKSDKSKDTKKKTGTPDSAIPEDAKIGGTAFKSIGRAKQEQIKTSLAKITSETDVKDIEKIDQTNVQKGLREFGKQGVKATEVEGLIGKEKLDKLKQGFPDQFKDNVSIQKVLDGDTELPEPKNSEGT